MGTIINGQLITERVLLSPIVWDDLRFPASPGRINPATLRPDFDYTKSCFAFDGGGTESIYMVGQLPHGYKPGTALYPHLHWAPTTNSTGFVHWEMRYKWYNDGETIGAFTSSLLSATSPAVPEQLTRSSWAIISKSDAAISSMVMFILSRIGGADTIDTDVNLYEFDLHFQIDTIGSQRELIK